ncbi:CBS domain-containing protein [Microvirga sp. P5_D2]
MLTAADVMTTTVVTVSPETPITEVARLLHERGISGVPVQEADGKVVGIVSEGDLIGHAGAIGEQRRSWWLRLLTGEDALARDYVKTHGRTVKDVMTPRVITVPETASLADIARLMERHGIKRVPVVRDDRLVGIVSRGNLLQALAATDISKDVNANDRAIRERLTAELKAQPWASTLTRNIVVEKGTVHLFGFVRSEEERRALRIAAENVPGVTTVEDHLMRREPSGGIWFICRPAFSRLLPKASTGLRER